MKEWFLSRGQTILSLIITIGLMWGTMALAKRYPDSAGTFVLPVAGTLSAIAVGLGNSLVRQISGKKDEDAK